MALFTVGIFSVDITKCENIEPSLPFSFQFVLRRPLTKLQFLGVFFIVTSIVVAKLPDLVGKQSAVNALPLAAILLALVACSNSGKTWNSHTFAQEGRGDPPCRFTPPSRALLEKERNSKLRRQSRRKLAVSNHISPKWRVVPPFGVLFLVLLFYLSPKQLRV